MKGSRFALALAPAAAIVLSGGIALAATGHPAAAAHTTTMHTTAAHTTAARSTAAHTTTVLVSCSNQPLVRPAGYMLACGDGSEYFTRLRWAGWTPSLASATGRFVMNTCTPSCARGKYLTSPVAVVLWHQAAMAHHRGQRQFLRMTVIYTGNRPAHTAPTFTMSLWYPSVR